LSKYHARFAIFISMIIAAAATAAAPNLSSQGLLAAGQKKLFIRGDLLGYLNAYSAQKEKL
jgi:hypothetical protein